MRIILHIFYFLKIGNGTGAMAKLLEHHKLMDSKVVADLTQWQADGQFDVLVCNGQHRIYVNWITQSESFVFGCILSGVVHLPDYVSPKAFSFLREGIRVVDSNLPYPFSLSPSYFAFWVGISIVANLDRLIDFLAV